MPETIEAEVIEIDGAPPPEKSGRDPEPQTANYRDRIRGAVLNLDRRWWPLWLLLGILALALALTVGVVLAVIVGIISLFRRLLAGLFGGGSGGSSNHPLGRF